MTSRGDSALRAADHEARLAAQREFIRPFLLEAGAGSGKTATLVARVLAWCLGPGWEKAEEALAGQAPASEAPPRLGASESPGSPRSARSVSAYGAATRLRGSSQDPRQAPSGSSQARHGRLGYGESEVAARVLSRLSAITFTEAAAAEMAERVGKGLAALEAGKELKGFERSALEINDHDLSARARALLGELDRLNISTIHAFCRRLLAAHPLEAGLSPGFEIDAEGDALDEALRDVLDEALPELYGRATTPAGAQVLALAELGVGPREIAEAVRTLVASGLPATALATCPFSPEAARELAQALAVAARRLLETGGAALATVPKRSTLTHSTLAAVAALAALEPGAGEDGVGLFSGLAQAVTEQLSEDNAKRLKAWSLFDFNQGESKALGERASATAEAAAELLAALAPLEGLDPARFEAARQVVGPLVAAVAGQMRRRGFVTYQDLLSEAASLLERHPDLAAFTRRGLDQLLVDEFQDTDAVQCALVARLAFSGPKSERPGLFVVGDPKQSIYGWRSADLAAYDSFVERLRAEGGVVERLNVSWRSAKPILDEIPRLGEGLFVKKRGVQPELAPLVPSVERESATGFNAHGRKPVEHWQLLGDAGEGEGGMSPLPARQAHEREAVAIASDIAGLHQAAGVRWGEFALLLRATSDLDLYLRAFQEAGVPYVVARDRAYYRRREVHDAAALVRTVLDPLDALALATVLRAVWVGVPDAALVRLWRRGLPALAAGLSAPESEELARLEVLAREVVAEIAPLAHDIPGLGEMAGWERVMLAFFRTLAELRQAFTTQPADRFVDRLRQSSLMEATEAARFLGAFRVANLERFFRELKETLDAGGRAGGDAEAVLRFLRRAVAEQRQAPEGRPALDITDAVQVMTIHKAKGLEFNHVYVAQLGKLPNTRGSGGTDARPAPEDQAGVSSGWELNLLGAPSPGWWRVEQHRRDVAAAEQVRLLYVAATRASERLVLSGTPAPPPRRLEDARSLAQLLAQRQPPPATAALVAGEGPLVDSDGVLWLVPEPEEAAEELVRPQASPPSWPDALLAARDFNRRVAAAAVREARPFSAAASAESHHQLEAALAEGAAEPGSRSVAMAVGTAFHRVVANVDLEASTAGLPMLLERAARELAHAVPAAEAAAATERFVEIFGRFQQGPLWSRLVALAPRLVARELPVLLPASGEQGPLGYVAGALDLVYRDEAGAYVVADFKTDEVADESQLEERSRAYQPQLAVYQRALKEALSLEETPRAELWFVALGQVVAV